MVRGARAAVCGAPSLSRVVLALVVAVWGGESMRAAAAAAPRVASSLAWRSGGGAGARALGFAGVSVPAGRLVPAPALGGFGRTWGAVVAAAAYSLRPAAAAPSLRPAAAAPTVRMMSGWKGSSSSSGRPRSGGGGGKRSAPDGGWGDEGGGWGDSDMGSPRGGGGGWGDDGGGGGRREPWGRDGGGGGRREPWGRDGGRGQGGRGGRARGGGGRGGRGGGRGGSMGRDRSSETREEMMERQREYQAVQAERKSWMQEQAEQFPGADYVHGVSPVLAALRAGRRTPHRLFMQETMDLSKRKDASAIQEIERLALEADCEVVQTDKGRLSTMSDQRPHQVLVSLSLPRPCLPNPMAHTSGSESLPFPPSLSPSLPPSLIHTQIHA